MMLRILESVELVPDCVWAKDDKTLIPKIFTNTKTPSGKGIISSKHAQAFTFLKAEKMK